MKGKEESIEISIPTSKKCGSRGWDIWKEDRKRAIFGVKVGIAVVLVSSLVLFEAPYQWFGSNIIWAVLTAILIFEHTVGATFNRGFNRALGSLLAGILASGVAETALSCGHIAEPIIIGLSIFLIAAVTSFMKMRPSLVQYEYGFRVILLTYCLIVISGYRMGNPIKTSVDRLYSMAIGGIISVLVNLLVCPIWAECVKKYLEVDDGCEHSRLSTSVMDEFPDEPAYGKCRNTLNSGPMLETLANSAKWEPPHGRFVHSFFYPWSEYENVGAALRYCAYEVMALYGILHSQIQAPHNLRVAFGSEIQEASSQAAELVREMGRDISNMRQRPKHSRIMKLHSATERLQHSTELHAYMLTSILESKPTSISISLSHASSSSTDQTAPELDPQKNSNQTEPYSYHEAMRKQSRRLYSWPSREVDAFDGDSGSISNLVPRMRALESTAALSLTNFTSTLVEFVARIDHLVHAVDKLSKMAKFQLQPS